MGLVNREETVVIELVGRAYGLCMEKIRAIAEADQRGEEPSAERSTAARQAVELLDRIDEIHRELLEVEPD